MYWREEPVEVDAILEGSWGAWAVEIKTGWFELSELRGLLEFCMRYPRFHPLVVMREGRSARNLPAGVTAEEWPEFLLSGPPRK